jgi:myo-inositol 2-dehydrogenase/D-chiro-inositol 1-dehydrogenase
VTSRPLRVAVAGLGAIGRIHARNVMASERMRLVAVASSDAARAVEHAAALGSEVAGVGVDRLLDDVDVDAVIVSSQTDDHLAYAGPVLERGRHLFLEKPGAASLGAHAELTDLAVRAGVVVATGYMRRHDPGFLALKRRVEEGAIGEPTLVSLVSRERVVPPAALRRAGGFIVDLGVHDFDIAAWILGQEPVEAYALVQRTAQPHLTFDSAVIVVRFDRGGIAQVHLSCTSVAGHDVRCEVVGTGGSIALNGLAEGVAGLVPVDGGGAAGAPRDFADRFEHALRAELEDFAMACAGGEGRSAGLLDDRRALAVGVAARGSVEERRPLAVGPDWDWSGPM